MFLAIQACFPSPHIRYRQSHTLAVKRLRWRPKAGQAGTEIADEGDRERELKESSWVQLASASDDHAVKIFSINMLAL